MRKTLPVPIRHTTRWHWVTFEIPERENEPEFEEFCRTPQNAKMLLERLYEQYHRDLEAWLVNA